MRRRRKRCRRTRGSALQVPEMARKDTARGHAHMCRHCVRTLHADIACSARLRTCVRVCVLVCMIACNVCACTGAHASAHGWRASVSVQCALRSVCAVRAVCAVCALRLCAQCDLSLVGLAVRLGLHVVHLLQSSTGRTARPTNIHLREASF